MLYRKLISILTIVLACSAQADAANRSGDNWYFGSLGGLTFENGVPEPLAGGLLNTVEGCATISDASGYLLFYTDGITVKNRNHGTMPNGTGLLGDSSSTQSAVAVPNPANDEQFYIFTADAYPGGINGLNYSIVDMTLDGGNGDVVVGQKNINLMSSCSEQLSVVPNADNTGYWVMGRAIGSNAIHAFEVTASGVNTTPVISNVGTSTGPNGEIGYLKPSPDGDKIAMAYYFANSGELYDFDRDTGVVSNAVSLGALTSSYGVEFSQDGKRLYISLLTGSVEQFDLEAADIAASKTQIGNVSIGAMQLGPDAKIYCSEPGATALSVINSPETLGVGCDFNHNTIPISGTASLGLPTFIQAFFALTAPTLTTTAASSVSSTTASSGGNISSDGGAPVTARGVCWSTSHNPTVVDFHTIDGTGTGAFTSALTSLLPGTTYYVRAYATNSVGTAYGNEQSFTTTAGASVATVTTGSPTAITSSTATVGGNVTSDGGASVTARGICWGTSHNPTISGSHSTNGTGTGAFTANLSSLTAGTTYYVRAYATNSVGTAYGAEQSFTTNAVGAPTVSTGAVGGITGTTADVTGQVSSSGGAAVTARGFCWGTSPNPTIAGSHTTNGAGTGAFSATLTGLSSSTTYHVRSYATNSVGTSYGNDVQFVTTTPAQVQVTIESGVEDARVGETIDFDIEVKNVGGGATGNFIITFEIPENASFESLSLVNGTTIVPADVQINGTSVTADLGAIDPAQILSLVMRLRVDASGELKLTASGSGAGITSEVSGESGAVEAVDSIVRIVTISTPLSFCGASAAAPMLIGALLLLGGRRRMSRPRTK